MLEGGRRRDERRGVLAAPLPFLAALGGAAAASAAGDGDNDGDGDGDGDAVAEPSVGSMTAKHGRIRRRPRRLVEVYENQRRLTALRPYSADDMLSWEGSRGVVERGGHPAVLGGRAVALPDGGGQRWVGDWRVDLDSGGRAEDGWQYAIGRFRGGLRRRPSSPTCAAAAGCASLR